MPALDRAAGRRSVRALLVDDEGSLVLIRRTKPGEDPYWTTPGGGVLSGEQPDDALRRELREELGATASIGGALTPSTPSVASDPCQTIYLARLRTLRPETRSGPEWTEQASGTYTIAIVPITDLATINLKPTWLRDLTSANAAALIAAASLL
ncbi:NUDIX domain-containing protein [Amycolatopsis roodepoortensis]|uniref:NUDIX domain-containing protein n=1 Tax=Amycolatopsis roodepoortensis TaxID=700274 RepID=UPI00214AA4CB|nr:NUDIX domain-containing protein [Amycolatopsis roodepoortensis]UUV32205.1 NUDIX domain-containing protein [Amycolatopsis roodepoortensis]